MSKINRYNGDLKAFGSNATGTERTVFGDVTQSDTLDDNITADFLRGWGIIGENDVPAREDFNATVFTVSQILAYLHQAGMAEYNASQEYFLGSACIDGAGKVYISKTASNVGNALPVDEDANWKRVLDFADLNDTALTGNPTAPTQAITDDSTRLATTEFVKSTSLTSGRTWQAAEFTNTGATFSDGVPKFRQSGVIYTNSLNVPIVISGWVNPSGINAQANVSVNGVGTWSNRTTYDSGVMISGFFAIVPAGATYEVTAAIGVFGQWAELR